MREQGKTFHEVEKAGNLYYLINAFIGAYNRRTDALSSGLHAIALALSTPQDNSAEVQKQIDSLVAQLNASTAEVKDAIDQHNKGD
jgi:stress-induced morphogen